jgi:hypothetical protein
VRLARLRLAAPAPRPRPEEAAPDDGIARPALAVGLALAGAVGVVVALVLAHWP